MTFKTALASLAALAVLPASALAQSFTGQDVDKMIVLMDEMQKLNDKYGEDAVREVADMPDPTTDGLGAMLGEDGSFNMMSRSFAAMEKAERGPIRNDLMAAFDKADIDDPSEFGETGDDIMMAYMAIEMDMQGVSESDLAMLNDPQMAAMVPPAMREQMAGIQKMMRAVRDVPDEDVAALKPHKKKLDAAMKR